MLIRVRLFALLREQAGTETLQLDLDQGATAGDALEAVRRRVGSDGPLAALPVAVAVNREYSAEDRRLAEGDEVALIPPVSGGAGATEGAQVHVRVTPEPLREGRVADAVRSPRAGALVIFEGTTRDVPSLYYEAYEEMAKGQIAMILEEVVARHGLEAAAAEHRVGAVALGEPSVLVAAAAAHREEAFAGAREAIDRIKAEAPIWKKEVGEDGTGRWVEGRARSEVQ